MVFDLNDIETNKIVSLFNQHEKNIDYLIYLRDMVWKKCISVSSFNNVVDQYKKRDSLFEEIEKVKPFPNSFIKKNIKWDTQFLKVEDYDKNPYLNAIKNLSFEKDDWSLSNKKLEAYSLFPYQEEYHYGPNYYIKMSLAYFEKDYYYPSISLYGNEWMSLNPYEIRTMETPIITARGKVLTLGLGLGYYAYMAHLKEDVKEVHVVEMDLELIKIFNEFLLPLFPHPEKIHIHKADAFHFVETIKDGDYDFIFADLWHDVSDGLPMYLILKAYFDKFKFTQRYYWIEGSLVTYLRMLIIGVMKDEYYLKDNDYDELQLLIKKKLANCVVKNSYDIDAILSLKGLNNLLL